MHLTRYTDYALRTLLYLGKQPGRLCSIADVANAYAISQNHLMKVVSDLVGAGYLESVRGRNGGIRLGNLQTKSTLAPSSAILKTIWTWLTAHRASSAPPAD